MSPRKSHINPDCPYCGERSALVGGDAIYPHRPDLYAKQFYSCEPCGAFVGCHPGTITPLGRLADASLRKAKSAAHRAFDPLWREEGMSRKHAYQWLARKLGIDSEDCHIGMFDTDTCNRVIAACLDRLLKETP